MAANVRIPFPSVFLLDVAGGNWMLHDLYALRLPPQLGQFQRGMVGGEAAMAPRSCEHGKHRRFWIGQKWAKFIIVSGVRVDSADKNNPNSAAAAAMSEVLCS